MSAPPSRMGSGHFHESWHCRQLPAAGTTHPARLHTAVKRAGKITWPSLSLSFTFLRGGEVLRVRHGGLQLAARPWGERQSKEVEG